LEIKRNEIERERDGDRELKGDRERESNVNNDVEKIRGKLERREIEEDIRVEDKDRNRKVRNREGERYKEREREDMK
jgi:hypothetical protein